MRRLRNGTQRKGSVGGGVYREVVEGIWDKVEESMRSKGWSKDGGPVEK